MDACRACALSSQAPHGHSAPACPLSFSRSRHSPAGPGPLPDVPGVSPARSSLSISLRGAVLGLPEAAVAEPGIIQRCPGMPPPPLLLHPHFCTVASWAPWIIRIKVLSQWHSPPCPVLPVIQRRKTGSPEPRAQRLVPVCRQPRHGLTVSPHRFLQSRSQRFY